MQLSLAMVGTGVSTRLAMSSLCKGTWKKSGGTAFLGRKKGIYGTSVAIYRICTAVPSSILPQVLAAAGCLPKLAVAEETIHTTERLSNSARQSNTISVLPWQL
jgi:hypothetical protein